MAKAPTPGNTAAAVRRSVVGRRARHTADESARPNQRRADGSDRLKQLNETLTRIGEAKARYFANISHELRTPLALILGPIEKLSADMFPGVAVIPGMAAGATDCRFLTPAGIPCYGVSGMFGDGATGNAHGLNERIRVQSLMEGREFLYRLVKAVAQ